MLFWVRAPLYTQASSLPACQSDAVLGPCSPVYPSKLTASLPIGCCSGSVLPCIPKQAHCQPANRMLFWVRAPLYTQASSLPACQSDAVLGPCSPVYPSKLTASLPIGCCSGSVLPCIPKQAHCQPANRMLLWVRAPLYTQASSLPACQSDAALGPCSPVYPSKLTASLPIGCCSGSVLPCIPK